MNGCVPDWDMEDSPIPSSSGFSRPVDKKPAMLDDELVELLWRDGQVVMQSQTQRSSRKSPVNFPGEDAVLPGRPEKFISDRHEEIGSAKNHLFIQEDEMASWLHYPLDDSFDREFCTDLFSSIPSLSPGNFCGGRNQQNPAERRTDSTPPIRGKDKVVAAEAPATRDKTAPESSRPSTAIKRHFSLPTMSKRGTLVGAAAAEVTDNAARESRVDSNETPAMGSGNHGSFLPEWRLSGRGWPGISASAADDVSAIVGDVETVQEGVSTGCVSSCMLTEMGARTCDTIDATVTSSSGGSACSGERNVKAAAMAAPAAAEDRKRKAREADESECQSEV